MMEEKNTVKNKELEKVVGGTEVEFYDGKPGCPICGKYPIRLIASDEYTDTYQCDCCRHKSVHTKKTAQPDTGPVCCPRCGCLSFHVLRADGSGTILECNVCRMQWSAPGM